MICLLYLIYAMPLGTDVRAQENSNATLEKMLSVMRDERKSISEIKNLTSAELGLLEHLAVSSGRTSTQAAFTALSVFFLGIALVLFGLRLTTRGSKGSRQVLQFNDVGIDATCGYYGCCLSNRSCDRNSYSNIQPR